MNTMHILKVRTLFTLTEWNLEIYNWFNFVHFIKNLGAEEILTEEQKKKPCAKFPIGLCQFGAMCRFSHYSSAELAKIKQKGKHSEYLFGESLLMNSKQKIFFRLF